MVLTVVDNFNNFSTPLQLLASISPSNSANDDAASKSALSADDDGSAELFEVDAIVGRRKTRFGVTKGGRWRHGGNEFDLFQQKHILENYIGPIDGGNIERNLSFLKQLMADNVPA